MPDETPEGAFELDLAAALDGHAQLITRLDELGDAPLERLLHHVRTTVPFYGTCGPALADFPLSDRDFVRDRVELLSTTHAADVARLRSNTNGTIARWLTVGFDPAAWYEMFQFSFARIVASREGLRDRLVPGEIGIHYLHDSPSDTRLTSYLPALGGVLLRRWPFGRDDDVETIRELREARPPILYAKPTVLLRAAEIDRALGGERIRPTTLATSGAPLYPRDRRILEDWYGCSIINAYVATEAGLIAIECEQATGMHVLEDRVLVEMLGEDGVLRDRGAGEVVITNFMNWAQPFVRYRLDDHGVLAPGCACGWDGPTLVELAGRDVAAYEVAGGGRIASARLAEILDRADLRQFEVSQPEPARLLVRWMPMPGADPSAIAAALECALRSIAGDHVEVRQVERITVVGGKGLRFVRKPWFP